MTETASFWVCAVVTFGSTLPGLGFSVVAIRSGEGEARTNAYYGFARCLALMIASAVVFINRSAAWLQAVALAMIIVQTIDAVIGAKLRDKSKTYGPATIAVINLATLIWFVL